eukprot:6198983-Pleurochrysis_carterae.AAC.4
MACFSLLCIPSCCHTCSNLRARASARAARALRGSQLLRTMLTAAMISKTMAMAIVTSIATFACAKPRTSRGLRLAPLPSNQIRTCIKRRCRGFESEEEVKPSAHHNVATIDAARRGFLKVGVPVRTDLHHAVQ